MTTPDRPSDAATTLAEIKRWIDDFSRERNWGQFHHPKDLGLALAIEVGEVLEHFRFRTNEQVAEDLTDPGRRRELAHELADCLWALVRLADICGIDLASSLREKLDCAGVKYPVEKVYGRSDKYTRYREPTEG